MGSGALPWSGLPFAELLEERAHVFWHFGFEGVEVAGSVGEAEGLRVEAEAGEDRSFLFFGARQFEVPFDRGQEDGFPVAIEFVAGDRMAEGLHVDADLVGASGMDTKLYQ